MQKWKTDKSLYDCERKTVNHQQIKKMDYNTTFVKEFLDQDPLRDWESFERCKDLWKFTLKTLNLTLNDIKYWRVLDCGTKDGQFVEYLNEDDIEALGIDISEPYVKYAKEKGRNVDFGNVCNMHFFDNSFDIVFSHHLLGLTSNYFKGLSEMFRVCSKYMVTLNDVPGNKKKHFSYIESPNVYNEWLKEPEFKNCKIIYSGRNTYWKQGKNEWILLLEKVK